MFQLPEFQGSWTQSTPRRVSHVISRTAPDNGETEVQVFPAGKDLKLGKELAKRDISGIFLAFAEPQQGRVSSWDFLSYCGFCYYVYSSREILGIYSLWVGSSDEFLQI